MAVQGEVVRIGRRAVKITHPGKVLFPEDGITKQEVVDYYGRIAPWILPHLRGRPVAMERYPEGIDNPGFFHKAVPPYYPSWIRTVRLKKKTGGTVKQILCENAPALVYLANQACLTPHIWLSRADKSDHPDEMVFDLDPSGDNFEPVKSTGQSLKELLDQLGLSVYLKTTGSRGLHVAVPLKRDAGFDSVRAFAKEVARIIVRQQPGQRTLEQRKSMRRGRVYVDTNRNAYAQTMAPAYALRARRGAPVSIPLHWHELKDEKLRSDGVTIRTVFNRLEKLGDPWADFWQRGVSLNRARQELGKRIALTLGNRSGWSPF